MRYAVLDTESTIFQKGHPFSARNSLCLVGLRLDGVSHIFDIEYSDSPYGEELTKVKELLDVVECVVGFNLKHDLNWLARYGVCLADHVRVFDCQLAEFILSNQSTPFPSLDGCCAKYDLPRKSDVVNSEYWSLGIDTPQVPMEVLYPYLENDLEITDGLYQSLSGLFSKSGIRNLRGLVNLHMQDLRVLQEMETNGIRLNWKAMQQRAAQTEEELNAIDKEILGWVPDVFRGAFNTRSNDHVSLLLYGGTHEQQVPEPYQHTYIGGPKAGTTETRNRWSPIRVEFPRLVDPLPKTALAKRDSEGNEAFWSTGADVLKELPGPKGLLSLLLKQSERSKLLTTYYHGFPAIAAKMDWQDGYLHGQFNQCNVITGRLSSSRPNQQNMPEVMNEFIQSRFS